MLEIAHSLSHTRTPTHWNLFGECSLNVFHMRTEMNQRYDQTYGIHTNIHHSSLYIHQLLHTSIWNMKCYGENICILYTCPRLSRGFFIDVSVCQCAVCIVCALQLQFPLSINKQKSPPKGEIKCTHFLTGIEAFWHIRAKYVMVFL